VGKRKRAAVSSAASAAPAPPAARTLAIRIGLVLLNLFVYEAVRRFQLVNWDDPGYITTNPTVLGGLSWSSAWWALTTGHSPYWHPVTWVSHLADVTLFGTDAGKFHLTNLVFHIANTLLVFEIFNRMTVATGRSAFVAAIFAAHPLHVESVAWIAERKDVLSTFFWALTILAYLVYVRRPGWQRYLGMLILYALALMSKPMVVTLPAVLVLLDVWPLRRIDKRSLIEKVPLLVLAFATTIATVLVQQRVGAMAALDALSWHLRAANATIGYAAYVWKTLSPTRLAAFYPLFAIAPARVAGAAVAILGVSIAVIAGRRQYPYLFVGWFWYLITISPVIGLLQAGEQGMADRFMYVPLIGLALMVAWGVPELVGRLTPRGSKLVPAAAIAIVLACAFTARAQAAYWQDSVTLWRHATQATPESYIAHQYLGQALAERGELEEARASYERALRHAPAESPVYQAGVQNSLGLLLTRAGKTADARDRFAAAARLNPGFAEAHSNLASALMRDGHPAGALPHYREALRLDPNLAQAHNGLGAALEMQAHDEEAMAEYTEALRLEPRLPTAHLNVARLFIKKGDVAQARGHLEAALSIDPAYEPARQALRAITRSPKAQSPKP
jgi:protein O-mannosyl-transferase